MLRPNSLLPYACALLLGAATAPVAAAQLHGTARDSLVRDDRLFSFYSRGPYRPAVPRPETVLGYAVGERQTQYDAQQRALMAVADAAKDRVVVEPLAVTAEGRPMRLYIVSAPENIQRLDAIRRDLDRLADPRGAGDGELAAIAGRTPAVVWLSGSVHGDEVPGFEASMQLLYQLAASEEPATLEMLRRTVVVINPSSNPDGHERFAVWSNSVAVGSPDRAALEQQGGQPWGIRGRFNHYRFDMNRDVIATTQQEVQGIVRGMLRWHPMVAADLHGYTTQYFFPPAARPVNANIGETATKWLEAVGRGNAAAFDRYGWDYYSRDVFDLYYPGYWDVWPSLTGAAAMTYETDGGPALLKRRDDGTLLSLRDGIAKHFVASMATIETTAGRAEERVRDYLRFRQDAVSQGRAGRFRQVVIARGDDPERAEELVAALVRAGVEVRRVSDAFTLRGATAYRDGAVGERRIAAGAFVVDMAQPQGRVAKAILEPDPTLDPAFARAQQEKFRRNLQRGRREQQEGYEFYDLTAWSLPVAFGVEAYWTGDAAAPAGEVVRAKAEGSPASTAAAGAPRVALTRTADVLDLPATGGLTSAGRARSAYLFEPASANSSRVAYHLLDRGYAVAVAGQPIEAGGRVWPRGTFIVRVSRNDSTVHQAVADLAARSNVAVTGVNSAFTGSGQYGTGSEPVVSLVRPNIAVVADEGVSQPAFGAIWWSLERRYGIRFAPVSLGTLRGADLARFNVVVVPDASPGALNARLGKDGAEALKRWVQSGGTLVMMGGASAWAAREDVGLTSARPVGGDTTPARPSNTAQTDTGRARTTARQQAPDSALAALTGLASPTAAANDPAPVPGANFDVLLDRTHWLTFGYERPRLTVMLEGDTFFNLSKEGTNVAVFPTTGPIRRAGFVWNDNTERLLRGTALLVDEPLGDGHVVLFANEPMFRGWWRALDKLVLNAMVLGPAY